MELVEANAINRVDHPERIDIVRICVSVLVVEN